MSIENTIRFLETASKFDVESLGGEDYEVRLSDSAGGPLAHYHNGLWSYYVTDCYKQAWCRSSTDVIQIDIEELDGLRDFCQILSRGSHNG